MIPDRASSRRQTANRDLSALIRKAEYDAACIIGAAILAGWFGMALLIAWRICGGGP